MKEVLAVLDRIACALEAYNERVQKDFKADYDAKMRKRGRLLLDCEKDRRFPELGSKIRNPDNQKLPITDFMIDWLIDDAKDAAAVLDHLIANPDTCARIGYSEDADARRQLQSIDNKLFSKAAPAATEALRSIFGNDDDAEG